MKRLHSVACRQALFCFFLSGLPGVYFFTLLLKLAGRSLQKPLRCLACTLMRVQVFHRIRLCRTSKEFQLVFFLAAAADGGALPSVRTTEPQVCSTRPNRLGDIISNDREPSCDLYHHYMCTCFHGISRGRNPSRYKRYYRHCLHFLLLALIRRCKNLGSI